MSSLYSRFTKSYSQAGQDVFVVALTKGKKGGTFLEIGSNDPVTHNNSYLLETEFDYRGVLVEYDPSFAAGYRRLRPNSSYVIGDAQTVNYRGLLDAHNFPEHIDYLQIDLDVNNRSTLNTLELLQRTVFDKYKFATVTFEHDIYTGNHFNTREISRRIFAARGYVLLFPDVSVFYEGRDCVFEDWYVHPDLVDPVLIQTLQRSQSMNHQAIQQLLLQQTD
jgi:hypothetical protein